MWIRGCSTCSNLVAPLASKSSRLASFNERGQGNARARMRSWYLLQLAPPFRRTAPRSSQLRPAHQHTVQHPQYYAPPSLRRARCLCFISNHGLIEHLRIGLGLALLVLGCLRRIASLSCSKLSNDSKGKVGTIFYNGLQYM
jgi:hypothetical protein